MDFIEIITGDNLIANAIRNEISLQTSGYFGRGDMKKKPNETKAEHEGRLLYALGNGVAAFNSSLNNYNASNDLSKSIKRGYISALVSLSMLRILLISLTSFSIYKIFKNGL